MFLGDQFYVVDNNGLSIDDQLDTLIYTEVVRDFPEGSLSNAYVSLIQEGYENEK